jgi:ADP-ribose pyrophosphatase
MANNSDETWRPEYFNKIPEATQYIGDSARGEIQIVERADGEKADGPPGVVFENNQYTIVRDAVRFPSGATSTPIRIIPKSAKDGASGVVLLAHRGGKLFFRRIFRHGTRRWEIETPRGRRDDGYTPREAAENEVKEELGFESESLEEIGTVAPDTALMPSRLPVFWIEVKQGSPEAEPEDTEALGPILELTPRDISARLQRGEITCGLTISALALAAVNGKIELHSVAR